MSTTPPTTAIIIANPMAGSYIQQRHQIEETLSYLRDHNWQVELKLTEQAGDAPRLTREAVERNVEAVIAVGGDGTINEIIQELAGTETALGVLPSGTINGWARETGIPLDNVGAREVLLRGRTRRIDLGRLNDRYFLLMAGVGVDAEVTRAIEHKPLKRFGVLSYLLVGTWLGLGYPSFQVIVRVGKRTIRTRAVEIIIGNTQLYGGAVKFTWRAKCDDGLLDICVVRTQNAFGRIAVSLDFLLRKPERHQWVRYEKCNMVRLHTNKPIAIQLDGEPAGYTAKRGFPPTTFTVVPGILKVIVPQKTAEDLFSQA
ncbi:MAG: diacylglycerol kinase family lipid kinase [Ktedonobacteraceae bacterium]|nr:diacylglycerol kinase family lipid kinase [Ktedonobacteraceae bacterium]